MSESSSVLTRQRRARLQAAGANLETKIDGRILNAAAFLEFQRQRDLLAINNRLNRFVVSNELKSDQTEAILETLLQVADLKLNSSEN